MQPVHTTARLIEAMAERSGHPLEIHDNTAYLSIGRTVWVAPLPPAGGAR